MALISPVKTWDVRERQVDVTINNRRYNLDAGSRYPLPHGIDNDVMTSIITLALIDGVPEDRTLHTTPHELLTTAMLSSNGDYYKRLRTSLLRLFHATYMIRDGWFDAQRNKWTFESESFRFIDKVRYQEEQDLDDAEAHLTPQQPLVIVLSQDLVEQLQAGFVHLPDPNILKALRDAPARSLYHFLEGQRERHRREHREVPLELSFVLSDLAQLLALTATGTVRAGNVRRSLQDMGEALLAAKYLEALAFTGRGLAGRVTFTFPCQVLEAIADPALVGLLTQEGLAEASARQLALKFPNNIERGVRVFRIMLKTYQSRGRSVDNPRNLLAAAVRNPAKYEATMEVPEAAKPGPVPARGVPVLDPDVEEVATQREWDGLDREELAERFMGRVRLFNIRVTQDDVRTLLDLGVDLYELARRIVQAVALRQDGSLLLRQALAGELTP
ncbi:replication initiator protein A [Deinococcus malanensis]|nr:replication initiator protein A [Deinococcus malanensis]